MLRFFPTNTIPDHTTADQSGHYVGTEQHFRKPIFFADAPRQFSKISNRATIDSCQNQNPDFSP